jgi:hypothetical protein
MICFSYLVAGHPSDQHFLRCDCRVSVVRAKFGSYVDVVCIPRDSVLFCFVFFCAQRGYHQKQKRNREKKREHQKINRKGMKGTPLLA